jgi:DtxR family Mn-dependent transcriptional regulator
LLDILRHNHIAIGTYLSVRKKFSFDNSLEVCTANGPAFVLSEAVAKHVWMKKIDTI